MVSHLADSSLGTIQDILLRMKALIVEGKNDSLSNAQRANIYTELNELNTEINAVSSSLTSNNTSLTTAIDTVASNLALEASRATTAEDNLANSIINEQIRAENAENDLQHAIHILTHDLEHLTREQADQLNNEIQRAQTAEAELSARCDTIQQSLTTRCDTLQQSLTVQTGYISQLYTYLFDSTPNNVPIR